MEGRVEADVVIRFKQIFSFLFVFESVVAGFHSSDVAVHGKFTIDDGVFGA